MTTSQELSPEAQELARDIDRLGNTSLRIKEQRDALLKALKAALPSLHWANTHGSRCDEDIANAETAIAEVERS